MPNATSRLQITIDAKNNSSAAIKQTTADLRALDNAAGVLSGGLAGLAGAAGVGALFELGSAAVSAAYDMARLAATAGDIETSFETLAAAGGESSTAMLNAIREASRGAISDYELMLTANRAMVMGVTDNTQTMVQLMDVARARSQAMGTTTKDAFDDLVTGISRLSPQILDNLGIVIDAEAAYEAYAQKIGVSVEALTEQEKKQIIVNEALRTSADLVKANAEAGDDLASNFERYEAAVTNAKVALGEAFGGPAAIALQIMTLYIKQQTALMEGEKDIVDSLMTSLQNLALGTHRVTSNVEEYAKAAGTADKITHDLTFGLNNLGTAGRVAADGMTAAELKAANLARVLAGLKAQSDATSNALAGMESAYIGAVHSAASAAVGILPSSEIARIYDASTKRIHAQQKAMYDAGMTVSEVDFRMQEMAKRASAPFDIAVESARAAEKQVTSTGGAVAQLSEEYQNLESAVQSALSGALDVGVGVDPDSILESMGLRPDAINEDARRLADVAVKGWESPWADYFRTKFPAMFDDMYFGGDIKAIAAQQLKDFEDGLNPQLIDKERAKERVRRLLLGDANMAQLAQEISQELATELGIPLQRALEATQGALGTGTGAGATAAQTFADAASSGLDESGGGGAFIDKFTEQMKAKYSLLSTAGRDAGKMWGTSFLETVGDSVPASLISILVDLVSPGVFAKFAQKGSLEGTAP